MPPRRLEGAPRTRDTSPWLPPSGALALLVVLLSGAPIAHAGALLDSTSSANASIGVLSPGATALSPQVDLGTDEPTTATVSATVDQEATDGDPSTIDEAADATVEAEIDAGTTLTGGTETSLEADLGDATLDATLQLSGPAIFTASGPDGAMAVATETTPLSGTGILDVQAESAGAGTSDAEAATTTSHASEQTASEPRLGVSPVGLAAPATVTGLTLFGLVLARGRTLLPWLLSPLYSRLTDDELLDHDERAAIYEMLQAEPGLSVTEVMDRRGTGWGQTVYHLERLAEAGFLDEEDRGRYRRFYPAGTAPEDREAVGLLRETTPRRIVEHLTKAPGSIQGEVASALGLAPSTVSKHLKRLDDAGLVHRREEGRCVRYRPTTALVTLLERLPRRQQRFTRREPALARSDASDGLETVA